MKMRPAVYKSLILALGLLITHCFAQDTTDNTQSTGVYSSTTDDYSTTTDVYSTTTDDYSTTTDDYSTTTDDYSTTTDDYSTTTDDYSTTTDDYSTTTDDYSTTTDDYSTTTDNYSTTTNDYSTTTDEYSSTTTTNNYSFTTDDYSTTTNDYSTTTDDYSSTTTTNDYSTTIHNYSATTNNYSTTTHNFSTTTGFYSATTDNNSSSTVNASSDVPLTTSAPTFSSTITSTTGPTTSFPTSATPREPSLENTFVNLQFSIVFNATWNDTYLDTSSDSYKKLSTDVRASLTSIYIRSGAPGYSNIIINSFSKSSSWYQRINQFSSFSVTTFTDGGAVIARYSAVFTAEAAYTQKEAILTALDWVQQELMNPLITIAGYYVNAEYVNETMTAEINNVSLTIEESQTAVCETSSVCYSYEQCHLNSTYPTGMVCIPGCYELACEPTANQYCAYEDGTTAVCVCYPGYSAISLSDNTCVPNCGDGQMKVGDSCVSAGLVIGLSVGLALAVIALLLVFTLFQLRTIKQLKKQQAIDQKSPRYELNDAFSNSRKSSREAIIDIHQSADKLSKSSLSSRKNNLPTLMENSPATLMQYEELKDYNPSFNGVDTETKFVLKRPQ